MNPPKKFADHIAWWVAHWIAPYLPPRQPLPVAVSLNREDASMLVYSLTLPPPGASDVVKRTLKQTVNGVELPNVDVTDGFEVSYNDNDSVTLSLFDTDDAGNESPPSDPFAFTATDTIAPPQPGQVGVALLREE